MNEMSSTLKNENSKFDNLYQVLIQEASVYDDLIELLQKKQKSIVSGQIDDLQNLTAKEQAVIRQANAFSNTRHFILKDILTKLNKNTQNASLSNLLEISGKAQDPHWQGIKQRLYDSVDKIKKLNFENQELLQTSLAFVKEMVKIFFPIDKDFNGTYSEDGKVKDENKAQQVLDCQI